MKPILILLTIIVATKSVCFASAEDKWIPAELWTMQAPGALVGHGYITESGAFRLANLVAQISYQSELESDWAAKHGAKFVELCRNIKYGFAASRREKRKHRLNVSIPLFGVFNLEDYIIKDANDKVYRFERLQQTIAPEWLKLNVAFVQGANTLEYANMDAQIVINELQGEFANQESELRRNGKASLEFIGHDYVACDFVDNLMSIDVEGSWGFHAAKSQRTQIISGHEVDKIYNRAKSAVEIKSLGTNGLILSAGILGATLQNVGRTTIQDFGGENFLKLHSALYDSRIGWKNLKGNEFENIASVFDKLTSIRVNSRSRIKSEFNGVIKWLN